MAEPANDDNVVEILAQHHEIRELFVRVAHAGGKQKREFIDDLIRLLAVHEAADAEVADAGVAANRLELDHEAQQVLAELHDLGVDHPEFRAKLLALAEALTAPAVYEEDDFRVLP
jgi:hypothetical protein